MCQDRQPSLTEDAAVQALVRSKALRLSRGAGFRPQDAEDLAQSLLVGLLQRLPDPGLGRERLLACVARAVEQVGVNLRRDRRARKRDDRRVQSLGTLTPGGPGEGPAELADAVGQKDLDARPGGGGRPAEDRAALKLDVAAVLERLPPDLRALAERLTTQSVAEAARDLGLPRTTLNERVRLLRMRFERAGLKDYLQVSSSP